LDTLTSGAVIELNYWKANAVNATNYTKAENDNLFARKDAAAAGYKSYETLALLPTTGTANTSYKVTNDPTVSNNGYYHWNGTAYVKDYDLVNDVTPSQLRYAGDLLSNKEIIYPLVSINGSTLIDNNFTRNGILDVKIINAQRDSWYSIGYFANNHTQFKDNIVIRRHSIVDGSIIEQVTDTRYKPTLTLDRLGVVVREISKEKVNAEGFLSFLNFTEGLQFLITIDYSAIPEGNVWSSSSLSSDNRISDDCVLKYATEVIAPIVPVKSNYIKKTATDLYISSKFDAGNDWLCLFTKCMANDLFTFKRVGFKPNTNTHLNIANIDATPSNTLFTLGSDNIGPISFNGSFIGGNHLVGTNKSADTISVEILSDDIKLNNNWEGYSDEIKIKVVNHIYLAADLPTKTIAIVETVLYRVSGADIEVVVDHDYKLSGNIGVYYGMQSIGVSGMTNIYFSNSQYADLLTYGNVQDSGGRTTNPNVDRIILTNYSKTIVQSLLLNRNRGLGLAINTNISSTDAIAFQGDYSKVYFRQIVSKDVTAGYNNFWSGTYSWFNQIEKQSLEINTLFAYPTKEENEDVFFTDFKATGNQFSDFKRGQGVTNLKATLGVTADNFSTAKGVQITATNAGSIKLK